MAQPDHTADPAHPTDRLARELWAAVETIHAVTYFHPVAVDAMAATGVKGFWMAYVAARAAPLGPINPGPVVAMFANFAPRRIERALPDAWSFSTPDTVLVARRAGAAAALAACEVDEPAPQLLDPLDSLVDGLELTGRPLAAANAALHSADGNPWARLWQACTTLREHRGDGHVATLVAAELDGCEANVLATAVRDQDPVVLRDSRAWSDAEWQVAIDRLAERGLVDGDGALTAAGAEQHRSLEATTDRLAAASYRRVLDDATLERLVAAMRIAARPVAATGSLPFPNPIGLHHAEALGDGR